jgi:hypothetical protein
MNFEDRLLTELKAEVSERAGREHARSPRRITGRRALLASATVAGIAAAAVIAVPIMTGSGSPAYAVSKNSNGTINIEIWEFKEAKRLQADLRDIGVNVIVDYLPPGKRCQGPRSTNLAPRDQYRHSLLQLAENGRNSTGFSTRLDPSVIAAGQTAFIEYAEFEPNSVVGAAFNGWIANGPVASCELISGNDPWPSGYPTR